MRIARRGGVLPLLLVVASMLFPVFATPVAAQDPGFDYVDHDGNLPRKVKAGRDIGPAERRTVDANGQRRFDTHELVFGAHIRYDDGRSADGPCVLAIADSPGTVYGGVVNPWKSEIQGHAYCTVKASASQAAATSSAPAAAPAPASTTPILFTNIYVDDVNFDEARWMAHKVYVDTTQTWEELGFALRRESGTSGKGAFLTGEVVLGARIEYNDGRFAEGGCMVPSAEGPGWVTAGVVNPFRGEIQGRVYCAMQAPAPPPAPTATTVPGRERRPTGDGVWMDFQTGDTVVGAVVQFQGQVYVDCYLTGTQTTTGGRVGSGVINPWVEEITNRRLCLATQPVPQPGPTATPGPTAVPAPTPVPQGNRQPTGVGNTLGFNQGAAVVGFAIRLDDGRTFKNCYFQSAPRPGQVQDGVIYPWLAELQNIPNC